MNSQRKVPVVNIANALTLLRVLLIPVFVGVYWVPTDMRSFWAWFVFAIAAFTDKLDGYLARSRGLITNFGKMADSLADKGLIAAALIMLSWHGFLWWWVTVVMLAREVYITVVRMMVVKKKVMAAGMGGKIKMFAQSMGAAGLIIPWEAAFPLWFAQFMYWASWSVIGLALVLSVWSAIGYTIDAVKISHGEDNDEDTAEEEKEEAGNGKEDTGNGKEEAGNGYAPASHDHSGLDAKNSSAQDSQDDSGQVSGEFLDRSSGK
ncbi:CDP-diacylglycerol--glycerol-3-phosphate 3-phosphatidyltransferase [Actinotignum urinale]|uniref:CDP-diacylglycerol--glycerol-3-phosphate 3-phosphatidyltransferase n=1 Tax=Actinotignum urinale TaxID=190146 RepID=A0ABU5G5L3_9ACTO|nr:CDP-diacylglycerol--glycerol-3-phosphate 3-phosphatidyltransferase [Actinotignum urinale]MDY5132339.1 CDP-diacylglycerol--glycerol-3-phosphate 3-phosphatidyltransferase [Actinotignum urinale]